MPALLLALALTAAPPRSVALHPVRHPAGRDAQAQALTGVLHEALDGRAAVRDLPADSPLASCADEACLRVRAAQELPAPSGGQIQVVVAWVAFGEGAVLSAVAFDPLSGESVTVARSAQAEGELPRLTGELARELGDRLNLPVAGTLAAEVERPTFGLQLKLGNAINTVENVDPHLSNFNLRLDLEGDYLAAPEFWPFVDLSLVLARTDKGQGVRLVPLLLGAKYVFRKGNAVRPFAGLGLGLGFLSANLDQDTSSRTSFAVYGVGGVHWFFRPQLGVTAEASLNLNGLEASGGAGVLFAVGFNLGGVVLF